MPQIGSFVMGIYRDESRTTSSLVAALCKAQLEYLPIELDEQGYRDGQSYKYASIHSIRRATLASNCKHGLIVNHIYGDTDKGECVTTVLRHESGEYMASTSPVPSRDDMQDSKANKTLLCRTHIEGLLGIVTERDSDGQQSPSNAAAQAQWAENFAMAKNAILSAGSVTKVNNYLALARQRIVDGQMNPASEAEIVELCTKRTKELSRVDATRTVRPEVADAARSGDSAPRHEHAGSAAAT